MKPETKYIIDKINKSCCAHIDYDSDVAETIDRIVNRLINESKAKQCKINELKEAIECHVAIHHTVCRIHDKYFNER